VEIRVAEKSPPGLVKTGRPIPYTPRNDSERPAIFHCQVADSGLCSRPYHEKSEVLMELMIWIACIFLVWHCYD